jgi:predicted metalloprotease with PDZ domain
MVRRPRPPPRATAFRVPSPFQEKLGRLARVVFRWRTLAFLGIVGGTAAAVLGGFALYIFYASDDLEFRYTIAIPDPRSGRIHVTAEITNNSKPFLLLRRQAGSRHMRLHNFRALTEDGEVLRERWSGPTKVITAGFRSKVILKYEVKPGGLGRHGHQGALYHYGGIVPGRILFFLPRRKDNLKDFLVRFQMPPGWRAVHAWERREGEWFDPRIAGGYLYDSLDASTIGFGRWHSVAREIGGNRFEVHTWDGWPPAFKERVSERAARIFQVLQELFGFRFPSKFVLAYVPRAPDGQGIIAGYWSNGMGNEMEDSVRNWSLYAHRLLHVLNRDHPYGMHLKRHPRYLDWDNPVNWFNEATASFFEVWATVKAGIAASDDRYNVLWEDYLRKHQPGSKFLVPLAREHLNRDEDVTEYLHYYKAPLFAQNLDYWMRRQTGGQKSLAGFISAVYGKYAHHKAAMPFFDELVAYAGFDLAPFFDRYAVDDDIFLPLWNDVFLRYSSGPREALGTVNGEPLLADEAYRRAAGRGPVQERELDRLVAEKVLEQELRRREVEALPPELAALTQWLPATWKAMLVRKMREALCRALYGSKGPQSERRLDDLLSAARARAVVQLGAGS